MGTWQCSIRETTNNVQCGWLMLGCDVKIDFGINLWERFTFRLTAIDSSDCPRLAASIPSQQGGYSRGELYFSHGCWRHAPISRLTQKVAPSDKVEDFLFWKIPSNVTKMRMINLHWSSKGWWCNFKACYWRFLIITDLLEIIVLDIVAFPLDVQCKDILWSDVGGNGTLIRFQKKYVAPLVSLLLNLVCGLFPREPMIRREEALKWNEPLGALAKQI